MSLQWLHVETYILGCTILADIVYPLFLWSALSATAVHVSMEPHVRISIISHASHMANIRQSVTLQNRDESILEMGPMGIPLEWE